MARAPERPVPSTLRPPTRNFSPAAAIASASSGKRLRIARPSREAALEGSGVGRQGGSGCWRRARQPPFRVPETHAQSICASTPFADVVPRVRIASGRCRSPSRAPRFAAAIPARPTRAHVEHPAIAGVTSGAAREAEPGRGVMSGPEAHGRVITIRMAKSTAAPRLDDRDPLGRGGKRPSTRVMDRSLRTGPSTRVMDRSLRTGERRAGAAGTSHGGATTMRPTVTAFSSAWLRLAQSSSSTSMRARSRTCPPNADRSAASASSRRDELEKNTRQAVSWSSIADGSKASSSA